MITQMHLKGLMFDPYNNAYIVVLRDEDGHEMLPIWVGKAEAGAISMALENVAPPRPMTHDFMKSILDHQDREIGEPGFTACMHDPLDNIESQFSVALKHDPVCFGGIGVNRALFLQPVVNRRAHQVL